MTPPDTVDALKIINAAEKMAEALRFYGNNVGEKLDGTNTYCIQTGKIAADRGLKARKAIAAYEASLQPEKG